MQRLQLSYLKIVLCLLQFLDGFALATIQSRGIPRGRAEPIRSDVSIIVISGELVKRTQSAAPPAGLSQPGTNDYQEMFTGLERAGWTCRFVPNFWFSPVYTSSGFLVAFFNGWMASVAAQMLANAALTSAPISGAYGPLIVTVDAYQRCQSCMGMRRALTWELLYYLLLYLRNHAARSFTGTGTLYLGHFGDEIIIRVSLKLRGEVG